MVDLDDYINKLLAEIEDLKSINESLLKQIDIYKTEIVQLKINCDVKS
jgi:hypothetical protein